MKDIRKVETFILNNQAGRTADEDTKEVLQQHTNRTLSGYFKRVNLGGLSGKQDLIKPSDVRTVGVTNLDNGKIEKGRVLVVTGISIRSMVDATINGAAYEAVSNDAALANAELSIKQNGKDKLKDYPVRNFVPSSASDRIMGDVLELPEPFILNAQSHIEAELNLAAALTANTNVEIMFHGYEYTR